LSVALRLVHSLVVVNKCSVLDSLEKKKTRVFITSVTRYLTQETELKQPNIGTVLQYIQIATDRR
jgi:hypothetical protein